MEHVVTEWFVDWGAPFQQISLKTDCLFFFLFVLFWYLDLTSSTSSLFLMNYSFVNPASPPILWEMALSTISCSTSCPCRHPPLSPDTTLGAQRKSALNQTAASSNCAPQIVLCDCHHVQQQDVTRLSQLFPAGSENESGGDGFVCGKG